MPFWLKPASRTVLFCGTDYMFWACSRRRSEAATLEGAPPDSHATESSLRWLRFSHELLRLAFKRRLWAYLGRWLRALKQGVRQRTVLDEWWTAL